MYTNIHIYLMQKLSLFRVWRETPFHCVNQTSKQKQKRALKKPCARYGSSELDQDPSRQQRLVKTMTDIYISENDIDIVFYLKYRRGAEGTDSSLILVLCGGGCQYAALLWTVGLQTPCQVPAYMEACKSTQRIQTLQGAKAPPHTGDAQSLRVSRRVVLFS